MDKPREYLFSESLENFTYDDYIKAGDDGPFYTVVSACAYNTLHAEALKLRDALKDQCACDDWAGVHCAGCKILPNFDKYMELTND